MAPKLVLVLVADQLNAAHVGFGGAPYGLTPNLDRLAAGGMRFDRMHATNPVCMPSRATMATGRWPSVHGSRSNGVPLDPSVRTIQGSLRAQGWRTAAVGKLHYQPMGWSFSPAQVEAIEAADPDPIDPALGDASAMASPLASWDWERMDRHADELVDIPVDYYGFEHVDLVVNHGDSCGGHYVHWLRERGVELADLAGPANAPWRSARYGEVWHTAVPPELTTTAYLVDRACRQIELAAAADEPTFLFVSSPDPHHPFCPPEGYTDLVTPDDIVVPSTFEAEHHGLPPHLETVLRRRGTPDPDPTFTWAADEAQHREAMGAQLGMIAQLDDGLGQILAAVDAAGLADDTLTVFTADHGELGGEHGLWTKHYAHYPAVTRVPFVLHGERIDARSTDALVSNADLVPTLIEATGTARWRGIQGRSLLPVARGESSGRRAVIVEEDQPIGFHDLPAPVRIRTIITDEGRYTRYNGQPFGELYLHDDDPHELVNRHDSEPGRLAEFAELMLDETLDLADEGRRIVEGA